MVIYKKICYFNRQDFTCCNFRFVGCNDGQFWYVFVIGEVGCFYCGGLGYRIVDCFKLEVIQIKQVQNIGRRDYLVYSSADY